MECGVLLQQNELAARGITDPPGVIETCRQLLRYILDETRVDFSYEQLVHKLQKDRMPPQFAILFGVVGKLLDAIQIIKSSSFRNNAIRQSIVEKLKRSGHEFVWQELAGRQRYEEELLKATATFQFLEVASLLEPKRGRNPISTLRKSMGSRLPEEYFAELLAGWIIEDILVEVLRSKGLDCDLEGPDRLRKIQFFRPPEMGVYDFRVSHGNEAFYLELQRVGKLSRERGEVRVRTALKRHKFDRGNRKNRILVLWIGRPKQAGYAKWARRLVFISDPSHKEKEGIFHRAENIYLPVEILDHGWLWSEFKGASGRDIADRFRMC